MYAFDPVRHEVVAVWSASIGALTHPVARLSPDVVEDQARELCGALSGLSSALWGVYICPASTAADDADRRRREDERDQFDEVATALRAPNLPNAAGLIDVSYGRVRESAHRVGRVLHRLSDVGLLEALVTEAQTEVDAVIRAELGDLSGRAVQAATLDRLDVSPLQVAVADEMLRADPLSDGLLSATVDPAAACVAAAHWLTAAAVVAAQVAGCTPAGVFAEADDIQAVPVAVPTLMVEKIEGAGIPARRAVVDLLRVAVAAGAGEIADLPGIAAERARFEESVQRLPADQRTAMLSAAPVRATMLDPRRPARDLLEHLLAGIASCHLLYSEYADEELVCAAQDQDPAFEDEAVSESDRRGEITEEFTDLVREQAASVEGQLR
ncbi:hypothetical protein [Actinoplanes sp. NPDC051411]|uniref:hypothetical protein n=1 Tax=Actinoplanes sp. NPDC051411 TaxID=3155522 RepID=UPI0034140A42